MEFKELTLEQKNIWVTIYLDLIKNCTKLRITSRRNSGSIDYIQQKIAIYKYLYQYKHILTDIFGPNSWYFVYRKTLRALEMENDLKIAKEKYIRKPIKGWNWREDMDSADVAYPIYGIPNEYRLKQLQNIAESLSWRESCGHDWDCCGCQFAQYAKIHKRGKGRFYLVITAAYNY